MAQTYRHCTLAFQAPSHPHINGHNIEDAHVLFGAALRGVCHACGAGVDCFGYAGGGPGSVSHVAPVEQRRMAAAAALREGLHLNHCQAVVMYGPALVQWASCIVRQGKLTRVSSRPFEIISYIIAFACDVPEIGAAPGLVQLGVWEMVVGWERDVWRRQSPLHRLTTRTA